MTEQEYISIVRKSFDNLNNHRLDGNDQYFATDMRVMVPGSTSVMNRDQGKMYTRTFLDAFPDLHFDLKDIITQGDRVAVTWVARGTHKLPLNTISGTSIPATNKTASVAGVTIYEFRNNLIVRQDIYWDQFQFLTQLGVVSEQQLASYLNR